MVIHTYFEKNNTIVSNTSANTGLNPVAELYYGGQSNEQAYSRFIFKFDESRLKELVEDKTFTDLSKLKHTIRMTNTGSFDKELLNKNMGSKARTCSFDLIVFEINQDWDNGVGYDYFLPILETGVDVSFSNNASNWTNAKTGQKWTNGIGVYSGSPVVISSQHFDKGNENIELDVSDYVNNLLSNSGATNYGLGIAFEDSFELMNTIQKQYVGFFTNNTQTFYEPYLETVYSNHIRDDRNNFFLDKVNELYLYVNVGGNPTNLDELPNVNILNSNGTIINTYLPSDINQITKGVYSISLQIDTNDNIETMYYDVWTNLIINGVARPNLEMSFVLKDSVDYYNMNGDFVTKKVAVSLSGLQDNEKIKRGDIRKVRVSTRIPYTVEQSQTITDIKYRLYILEGPSELTVIDFQAVEMASNYSYFLLDTASLLPNKYHLDVLVTSNLEVTTLKTVMQFEIINQVELRKF